MQGSSGEKGNLEKIGEGMGGIAGRAGDMGMNMLSTLFGTAMGSMTEGWSQGQGGQGSARPFGETEDQACRRHFEAKLEGGTDRGGGEAHLHAEATGEDRGTGARGGSRDYETTRPLYQFGHVAAQNPEYRNRSFTEIEPDLRKNWGEEQRGRFGDWPEVRGYVDFGYNQGGSGEGSR